jgi:hypothetical protein
MTQTGLARRFPQGDPVCTYWLARCEGFTVERHEERTVATVADVVLDGATARAVALRIARRGRVSTLAAEAVTAVVPERRALVIRCRNRPPLLSPARRAALATVGKSAVERSRHAVRVTESWVLRTAPLVAARVRRTVRAMPPRLRRAAAYTTRTTMRISNRSGGVIRSVRIPRRAGLTAKR